MFKGTIIKNALVKVANRLNIKARETVLFENRHKHIDEINTILRKIYHKNEIEIVDVGGGLGINLLVLRELLNNKKIELYLVDRFVEYNEDNKMGSFEIIKNLLLDYDI
jgi:16S rRNA G527 N7-methylase RsmG